VTDAAILLGVIAGYDPADSATAACQTPGRCYSDYTRFLDANALNGARIGYENTYWTRSTPDRQQAMNDAIALLQSLGATVVPVSLASARTKLNFASTVLKYGMKRDLNAYLASLGPGAPVKTLADVIAFNNQHLDVVIRSNAREINGVRGLDATPEFAPEVEFPGDVEADAGAPHGRIGAFGLVLTGAQYVASQLLQLRIERAAGDAELGARFENAQAGRADVVVPVLRFGDQPVEHRIVEIAPPLFGRPAIALLHVRRF
jgi:hypothetical protein